MKMFARMVSPPAKMRVTFLRRSLRCGDHIPRLQRFQHGGPHKEYFQNPNQFPSAAVPQYTLPPPLPPFPPPPPSTFPAHTSLFQRLSRSTFWAMSFGLLGIVAGTAAITYEYLQPLFEVGTEEELEELEGIKEIMASHPLLDALARDEHWKEQAMYMEDRDWDQEKDYHFLSRKTLKGANGVSMAFFSNVQNGASCLMFFPGTGVEGWPDVVHGGIICALLQETMEQTANLYHSPVFGRQRAELVDLEVNFRVPLQPGNVYAVFAFVKFAELGAPGGLGTPIGSSQRTTRNVHAFLLETADLDWGNGTGPLVTKDGVTVHATALGILKDAVYMSEEDYTAVEDASKSSLKPS